jgi:2-polyprenyl-3-methyl-5-hydroxy-6-metoxy-1,4-benzoquinol methylase
MDGRLARLKRRTFLLGFGALLAAATPAAQQPRRQPEAKEYIKILEDPHRIERLKPAEIIRTLGLRPGNVVADIGSGSGLFTRPLARTVLPGGRVYAVDIDPELLQHVRTTAEAEGITNITTVHAPEDSPGLRPASVDLALMCDTLHHVEKRQLYLANLKKCIKPGGRFAIIDFLDEWPENHLSMKFSLEDLDRWTAAAGYEMVAEYNSVPGNFFRIYKVNGKE